MLVLKTRSEMLAYRASLPSTSSIGIVPTMGSIHGGHCSLMRLSRSQTDITIASIFVNPNQFAPTDDFSAYPRNLARDLELCREVSVDAVYAPASKSEVYSDGFSTRVSVGEGDPSRNRYAEGFERPSFFEGVATILTHLFALVRPTHAFFGQKDAQQCAVVNRLITDMFVFMKLVIGPVVREKDGLAMSSRNVYLTGDERQKATILYESLKQGKQKFLSGVLHVQRIRTVVRNKVKESDNVSVDYVSVCDRWTMLEIEDTIGPEQSCLLAIAARIGTSSTRLLDNVLLRE